MPNNQNKIKNCLFPYSLNTSHAIAIIIIIIIIIMV
jgi:hypothetical protein